MKIKLFWYLMNCWNVFLVIIIIKIIVSLFMVYFESFYDIMNGFFILLILFFSVIFL